MLTGLLKQAHKIKFLVEDNSTTILTGLGVAGVVATAYLSGHASFKAGQILEVEQQMLEAFEEHPLKEELEEQGMGKKALTKVDKAKLVWYLYIPAVGVGVLTVTSIIVANKISSKKIAALVVASGISDRAFTEYKAKVVEKLGVRQDQKIRDEVAQDRVTNNPPSHEIVFAGTGSVICFDSLTGRYFESSMEDIKKAENRLNYEIIHYNAASLTFFYEEIGLAPTDYTDSVGWGDHVELLFSTALTPKNQPCIVINFSKNPLPDYDKTWR